MLNIDSPEKFVLKFISKLSYEQCEPIADLFLDIAADLQEVWDEE